MLSRRALLAGGAGIHMAGGNAAAEQRHELPENEIGQPYDR